MNFSKRTTINKKLTTTVCFF